MKRSLVYLLILASVGAYAADSEDFSRTIAYDVGLPDVFRAVQEGNAESVDSDRFILLQGAVASRTVLNPAPDNFVAEVVLIDGQWDDVVAVHMYMAKVILRGPEFAERIPVRRMRNPPPNEIVLNTVVLIAAKFVGTEDDPDVGPVPVFDGYFVRSAD